MSEFFEYVTRFPALVAESTHRVALANEKTAHDIVVGCKARSRVDTGEMQNGWDAIPVGGAGNFSSSGMTTNDDALDWVVYNPVEHSLWNEIGTTDMAAQPMLEPAVEDAREPHAAAIAEAFRV